LFVSPISTSGGPIYILEKILERVRHEHQSAVLAPGDGELFDIAKRLEIQAFHTTRHELRWRAIPWMCKLIIKHHFELVYCNSFRSGPRNALIAARLTRRPCIWHINELLKGPQEVNRKNVYFLKFAQAIIADAKASREAIQQYVPHKEVHLIYNGIDPQEFNLDKTSARSALRQMLRVPAETPVVLNAGLLCARKGQEYSLMAAQEVLKTHPQTQFVFLGEDNFEPEYARKLQEYVQTHRLDDNIHFLGYRNDYPQIVAGADLFLHTALRDPFPVAILGAMAAGIPVVAFEIAGVDEQVVSGETGILAPLRDVQGIATAVIHCLNSPNLRRQLGEASRQRVEAFFSARAMCDSVLKVIDTVVG